MVLTGVFSPCGPVGLSMPAAAAAAAFWLAPAVCTAGLASVAAWAAGGGGAGGGGNGIEGGFGEPKRLPMGTPYTIEHDNRKGGW